MTAELPASPDRRAVLRGAALAGGAVAVGGMLAACSPQGAGTSAGGQGAQGAPAVSGRIAAAEVPVGGGIVLPSENVVITQPQSGEFRAFSAICTHEGCPVSAVDARGIKCPCHSSFFDPSTGAVVAGPAKAPLPSIPCRAEGTDVAYGG